MKQFKWLIVLVVCCLSLLACQNESTDEEATGETDAVQEEDSDEQEEASEVDAETEEDSEQSEPADETITEDDESNLDGDDETENEDASDESTETEKEAEPFEYDMEEVSFRMDTDKEYTKKVVDEGEENTIIQTYSETTENEKGVWDHWLSDDGTEEHEFVIMEDEEGLYIGIPQSEYYQTMGYPIEEGETFEDWEDTYTTTAVDDTMTVEAGEFEHVVEVESPEGSVSYFAPDVGEIQTLDDNGEVITELVELN